ncbi:MAG: hypothetical protein KC766_03565 [Myxococcales bacterium]|nr:hypothetical protein [Myxococcales bacterium]
MSAGQPTTALLDPSVAPANSQEEYGFDDEEQVSRVVQLESRERVALEYHAQYRRLQALLSERRYEDALDLLCSVREAFPEDQALTRSIRLLRDHLSARYARRLEDLDVVPRVARQERNLAANERRVLELVDGVTSFGELLLTSPLGQFDTLRALFSLIRGGVIVDDTVASASRRPPPPRAEVVPTAGEVRRLLAPLDALDGFWGAALVDSASATVVGTYGGNGASLQRAAALYGELLQVERRANRELGLATPDDLIITRPDEYHLLRPLRSRPDVFVYLVTQRRASNLVLSRLALAELDGELGDTLASFGSLDLSALDE